MVLAAVFLGTVGWTWGKKQEGAQLQTQQAPSPPAAPAASGSPPEAPAAASVEAHAEPTASGEAEGDRRVVYKFASKDEMKGFLQMWQQRQAIMMRMAVLQAYWNEEQDRLTQVNKQLAESYHMDLTKRYVLEDELMHLIELKDVAEPEPSIPAAVAQ